MSLYKGRLLNSVFVYSFIYI